MIEARTNTEVIVGMADLKVGQAPTQLTTNLGSCIGVCLYAPQKKAGGLLHLMLAYAGDVVNKGPFKKAKYADTGITELLHQLKTVHQVTPKDCVAKLFGGGQILKGVTKNIGAENEEAVRVILKIAGIRVLASKTGGDKGYRVKFDLETGKVICQIFGGQAEEF